MVKKTIITAVLLMLTFIPAAQANGAYASYQENQFIEVKYELKSDEIAIGGQMNFDVTISNLTSHNMTLDYISTDWITKHIDESDISIGGDNNSIGILKPYETIVLEIRNMEVKEKLEWYKKGDEYYVDFKSSCIFIADLRDDGIFSGCELYYDIMENAIPLKITNVYDGSDYFEFKWLDDRDTMYFYNKPTLHEQTDFDELKPESYGVVAYEASLKNISSFEMSEVESRRDIAIIEPDEEIEFCDYHTIYKKTEDMNETQICHFRKLFLMENKYYAIEYVREYHVKYLEPPKIELELIPNKEEDQEYPSNLTLKAKNISSNAIEDLMISVFYFENEDYTCVFETKDLENNEVLELVHDKYNHGIDSIEVGYYFDGILYSWALDDYCYCYSLDDNVSVKIEKDDYELYNMCAADIAAILEKPSETQTPAPEITPSPTPAPTDDIKPADTDKPIAVTENTPNVTVAKRQDLLFALLIAAFVLVLFAVVMITIEIMKKRREKSSD